jgi:hypothetical protein
MTQETCKWRPDRRVAWRTLDGRAVLVGGHEGKLYVLNGTGAEVWGLVCAQASVEAMVSALESRFTVSAQTARADVVCFLGQMQKRGLVEACEPP